MMRDRNGLSPQMFYTNIFLEKEQTILRRGKFSNHGTRTKEGAENKNRTAKSVTILIGVKLLRSF